jgi:hypothetical protein
MKDGDTLDASSSGLAVQLQAKIKRNGNFYRDTKGPDSKTLEGICSEVRVEIEQTYGQVESTLKT